MKLIYEENLNGIDKKDFPLPSAENLLSVYISGELSAKGTDRRLLVNVNNLTDSYQGYVLMTGSATGTEFEESGFYVGRTGWNDDGDLSVEMSISSEGLSNKIITSGLSTFTASQNRILGYQFNSYVTGSGPIKSLSLDANGGLFTGKIQIFTPA